MDIIACIYIMFFSVHLVISLSIPHFSKKKNPEISKVISYLYIFFPFSTLNIYHMLPLCEVSMSNVLERTMLCTHKCDCHMKPPQTVLAKNGKPNPPKLLMGMLHGAVAMETSRKLLKT